MQPKRIRIAVIDDHRVFAEALAGRLSVEPDLAVVGTAGSSGEALDLFSHHEADVVTLDLDLAGEDGLALGRRLRDRWPDLGIVVVTGAADDDRVCEAMQIGVRGWAVKQGAIEAVLIAIRGAARGETHLPADLLTRVLVSLSDRDGSSAPEADAVGAPHGARARRAARPDERNVPPRAWCDVARLARTPSARTSKASCASSTSTPPSPQWRSLAGLGWLASRRMGWRRTSTPGR